MDAPSGRVRMYASQNVRIEFAPSFHAITTTAMHTPNNRPERQ